MTIDGKQFSFDQLKCLIREEIDQALDDRNDIDEKPVTKYQTPRMLKES